MYAANLWKPITIYRLFSKIRQNSNRLLLIRKKVHSVDAAEDTNSQRLVGCDAQAPNPYLTNHRADVVGVVCETFHQADLHRGDDVVVEAPMVRHQKSPSWELPLEQAVGCGVADAAVAA